MIYLNLFFPRTAGRDDGRCFTFTHVANIMMKFETRRKISGTVTTIGVTTAVLSLKHSRDPDNMNGTKLPEQLKQLGLKDSSILEVKISTIIAGFDKDVAQILSISKF